VLRLFTLLQFLPGAWWTTRVGVERGIYPEFPPVPASPGVTEPASGPSAEEWKNVIGLADREVHGLLGELSARGAPVPEVGFELLDTRGAVLAEAELGWPAHEIAVLLPDQTAHVAAFERAGWRVFTSGTGDVAELLADALPLHFQTFPRSN
jgi:DEAD/DEAH box helicase domain-containing protein